MTITYNNQMINDNECPNVSVIIPVYNCEKTIGDCIESILKQNYPKGKIETIVVDNNSMDKTLEIIRGYPVTVVTENKVQGPAAARNRGAAVARGEVFVFFDADQIATENFLRNLLIGWHQKEIGAFGGKRIAATHMNTTAGQYWKQNENTKISTFSIKSDGSSFLKLSCGNAAYRRAVFEKLGGFDPCLFALEDYDLALRLQRDLGYSIKYNFDAINYHKERPNWKSLMKREYKMGFGEYLFGRKHSECKRSLFTSFVKVIKITILNLIAELIKIFKYPRTKNIMASLRIAVFDIAMCWSNFFGKLQAYITKGKRIFPANW